MAPDPDLEHDLGRLLADSVQDLHPPVAVMIAEATRHGRVLRRRRRLGTAASAGAVLALAVTVALTGLPGPAGVGTGPAAPTSAPNGTAATASATAPTADAGPELLRARQRTALQSALAGLLGPGTRLDPEPGADQLALDPAADAVLWTRYDDGRGAATVSVEVHGPASQAAAPTCELRTDGEREAGYRCSTVPGPGRDPQVVEVLETAATGWVTYRIWTPLPDGTRVAVAVHNGTLHDPDDPILHARRTRDAPPHDLTWWQEAATDGAWRQIPGLDGRSR
ncbi:hypothetical protein PUR61_25650 [Streptomyces sp. BE20]|uniref:hypothetical protein n=1 Tax=unclassified Streptomyces TaxID=2593676 RepID=UPI002E786626|nr:MULTISPECIES: hypothetical protein [unclassified Streptomyces]MED7949694.1 hypothetical protein [Streptomyces sp. BE303]MEE1825544.1 hypothetical protein [Streptomyces sp. BE20]